MNNFLRKKWSNVLLSALFFLGILGFLVFEKRWPIVILLLLLVVFSLRRIINDRKLDWAIYLVLFLVTSSLYNFYMGMNWSLGLIMLAVVLVFCFCYFRLSPGKNIFNYLHTVLAGLVGLEIFLALIPWPIEPRGKSLILVGTFFTITNIIKLYEKGRLNAKEVIKTVSVYTVVILLVVLSSRWFVY